MDFNLNFKKIKVLNVIPSLQDGGIEALIYKIYRDLDKSKYDLHVCCLANIELRYSYKRFLNIGCDVKTFKFVNTNRKFYHLFVNFYYFLKFSLYLISNRFEIVHSQDFFSALITRTSLILLGFLFYRPKRNFVTLHNMPVWLNKYHRIINKILSFSTDKILCISDSVFKYSLQNDKIKESKYTIIFNGIDYHEFKPNEEVYISFREELGYTKDDFIIGHVGTFSVRKGQEYLVKAFADIYLKYPKLNLLLVGGYRTHEPQIYNNVVRLIEENKLSGRVKILSTRDDIIRIYNILDLFVMPSTIEGFGLALAEAMSAGCLVIVSDIPPFKEIIDDGNDGFLFESKNYKDLTSVIEKVLTKDKEELKHIASNARNKIKKKFNSEIMVRDYEKLYNIRDQILRTK